MNDLRSLAYWIGHMVTLLATVIGVYFAASSGFRVAVNVEQARADRGTYYLAESLLKELQFNVENMQGYIEKTSQSRFVYNEDLQGIELNDYVFSASKFSDSTFEIPPSLLNELSAYYFIVGNALDSYYQSGKQSPQQLMDVVSEQTTAIVEAETIERLIEYNQQLAKTVQRAGFQL